MPKRKSDRRAADEAVPESSHKKPSLPQCMLHVPSVSDHAPFIALSKIKGTATEKLQYLQSIRDRRLRQSYRMQSVCDQIPSTLPDNVESMGYHRLCYQRFTGSLHLLGEATESEASTSSLRSPRKLSTESIFPPECIFCEKLEIKGSDRKTERAETFSSWKDKTNAWEQIESQAEQMGLLRLHHYGKRC